MKENKNIESVKSFNPTKSVIQTNIPKLRFPEFKDKWEKRKLIDIAPLQRGFDLPIDKIKVGIYPVVFSNGILKYHNEYKAKAPGVVTGRSGTIGKVTFVEKDYWVHNTALWVTDFKNNDPKYIYYFYSIFGLERFSTGSSVPTLNRNVVHSEEVLIPSLPEQTKIAKFLTAIDRKIEGLKKKKELLEQYKKGVMQKIFSQEIRFKDDNGKDFPKWEKKKLGEVGEILTGKTPSTKNKNLWNGDIQFVTPTDIVENKYQLTTQRNVVENSNLKILPKLSIMFTCIASIGKMSISIKPCITNQQINSIVPNNNYDNEFVYYSLLYISDFIKSTKSTTTLPIINKTEFSNFEIFVPQEIKEQVKISKYFSVIDLKIERIEQELAKTEEWKKGLLQQMFC